MKVSFNAKIEDLGASRRGVVKTEEGKAILEFIQSDQENICFEYDTEDEAKKRISSVYSICKKVNADKSKDFFLTHAKRRNKIYVVKVK